MRGLVLNCCITDGVDALNVKFATTQAELRACMTTCITTRQFLKQHNYEDVLRGAVNEPRNLAHNVLRQKSYQVSHAAARVALRFAMNAWDEASRQVKVALSSDLAQWPHSLMEGRLVADSLDPELVQNWFFVRSDEHRRLNEDARSTLGNGAEDHMCGVTVQECFKAIGTGTNVLAFPLNHVPEICLKAFSVPVLEGAEPDWNVPLRQLGRLVKLLYEGQSGFYARYKQVKDALGVPYFVRNLEAALLKGDNDQARALIQQQDGERFKLAGTMLAGIAAWNQIDRCVHDLRQMKELAAGRIQKCDGDTERTALMLNCLIADAWSVSVSQWRREWVNFRTQREEGKLAGEGFRNVMKPEEDHRKRLEGRLNATEG